VGQLHLMTWTLKAGSYCEYMYIAVVGSAMEE